MSKNLFGKNVDGNENNTFNAHKLTEELLLELNRNQLISKSKKSDKYKTAGRENENRWTRRNKSTIATRVDQYNKIDMNELFKNDEISLSDLRAFFAVCGFEFTPEFEALSLEDKKKDGCVLD